MTHPNDMTHWSEIGCEHGHETHDTIRVGVQLGGHGYHDYPRIPARFERWIDLDLWDWRHYVDLPSGYCPARDAVSETIATLGVWEPIESTLVLSALTASEGAFVDMGAQLGWFSALAASTGVEVWAYEADPQVAELLARNVPSATVGVTRIGPECGPILPPGPIALAKLDLEGAEIDAVEWLWPRITDGDHGGDVDHLLIEISPVFHDGYPKLVTDLIEVGYDAYLLPDKATPPHRLVDLPRDLHAGLLNGIPLGQVRDLIAGLHQVNIWFARLEARWA